MVTYSTIKLVEAVDSAICHLHRPHSHNKHLVEPYFGSCLDLLWKKDKRPSTSNTNTPAVIASVCSNRPYCVTPTQPALSMHPIRHGLFAPDVTQSPSLHLKCLLYLGHQVHCRCTQYYLVPTLTTAQLWLCPILQQIPQCNTH